MSKSNVVYNFWVIGNDGVRYWYTQTESMEALEPRVKEFMRNNPPTTYRITETTFTLKEYANADITKEWPL
jgi:hypothetical protein